MNIKELADKYKSQIPQDLDEYRFLKSLYIKIGQDRIFDEKYYFGNSGTMKKIYSLAKNNRNNRQFELEKRTIICYSLSYTIEHLLEEIGYNCMVTHSLENGDHVFPIVMLSDGRRIKYDLQKDLENIQTRCKTEYFATSDNDDLGYHLTTINDDEQTKIDIDINYIENEEEYKNVAIDNLHKTIKNNNELNIWQKLQLILKDEKINDIPKYAGYVECFRFYYKRVLPEFFSDKELAHKIKFITCSKSTGENSEYTNCIFVEDETAPKAVYMFSRIHNRYILTPYEKIIELEQKGLNIGVKFPTSGVNKLKKEMEKYRESKNNQLSI